MYVESENFIIVKFEDGGTASIEKAPRHVVKKGDLGLLVREDSERAGVEQNKNEYVFVPQPQTVKGGAPP
jgi:hypothetical protein